MIVIISASCTFTATEKCVQPPVTKIPPSMGQPRMIFGEGMRGEGGVPQYWSIQPNVFHPYIINGTGANYEGIHNIIVSDETIWIGFSFHILKYNFVTGKSITYQLLDPNNRPFSIFDIILTRAGELLALVVSPKTDFVTLSFYDSRTDKFELVIDEKGILQEKGNRDYNYFVGSQVLAETQDGKILLPFKKNILSYDPKMNSVDFLLPKGFSFSVSAIAISDNNVWFSVGQDMDLRRINLSTGELVNYGHTTSILDESQWVYMKTAYRSIAVDKFGRIWMGYFARLVMGQDGKYSWEKVTYPPQFVIADDPQYKYIWSNVYSVYTSSDGNLWFNAEAGLVEYDTTQDSWCLSMPVAPPLAVTEDNRGNLWMALSSGKYNSIYELENATAKK